MITTNDIRMVRGSTWRATFRVVDERGARVPLTIAGGASADATIFLRVRPDLKAAPVIQLAVASGITVSAQTGSTKGEFVATIAPALTAALPIGEYDWDAWVVIGTDKWCVVAPSKLTILQEVTTPP